MNQILVLILGLLCVFGLVAILIERLRHDTAQTPARHQRTRHSFAPVVIAQYSDRIRAMQDRALDLLEEQPLRRYTDLLFVMLAWAGLAPADQQGPARNQRVGPQDPFVEVPHQNRL
ncbi:hypothetical protein FRC01_011921 [Tulasnella sp. 417]|nr:hypothetical protein FRC01_011921 [Tulasnella sp. 417]